MQIHAIIPVNDPKLAKTRLSPLLSGQQRKALTFLMFRQVTQSVLRSKVCNEVHVTSPDRDVLAEARRMGARPVREYGRRNLNNALLKLLSAIQDEHDAATALIIHADLPLLKPRDIDDFARLARRYSVVIVPSRDRLGTTALATTPPTVLRPKFGASSFKKHLREAHKVSLSVKVYDNVRLGFDVDQPRDISILLRKSKTRPEIANPLQEILNIHSWS